MPEARNGHHTRLFSTHPRRHDHVLVMMRHWMPMTVLLCLPFLATAADAVEFSLVSPGVVYPDYLGRFSLEIRMTNLSEDSISSIGASVYGYDGFAYFDGGSAVSSFFHEICVEPQGSRGIPELSRVQVEPRESG